VGKEHLSVFNYKDNAVTKSLLALPELDPCCHSWISAERILVGTTEGKLILFESGIINETNFNDGKEAVSAIVSKKSIVVVGGEFGSFCIYSYSSNDPQIILTVTLPDSNLGIIGLSTFEADSSILVKAANLEIYKISMAFMDESATPTKDKAKFEVALEASHSSSINGLDLCIRKPLFVTCSSDKSIKIWNYLTDTCELTKIFVDEPLSISLHPSGLYVLAGFSDKLRLFNILMDDLRLAKEFSIRACKKCCFSNGGHLIAATNGNAVQLFSAWTFETIGNLKGHNGKVKSIYFTPDDMALVTAGSDGAVYTWDMSTMKRENEHIQKSCSYLDAVCLPNSKTMFAVGTDRHLKEITESAVARDFEGSQILTQIAMSSSGSMLFAGTHSGAVRALRFPLGNHYDFQDYQAHSGPITKIKVSFDEQYLFSAGEDGCVYKFHLTDKEGTLKPKQEKAVTFADEVS
jgi:cilia- and flagella-associated protein 57